MDRRMRVVHIYVRMYSSTSFEYKYPCRTGWRTDQTDGTDTRLQGRRRGDMVNSSPIHRLHLGSIRVADTQMYCMLGRTRKGVVPNR
jgi:hypothetical protein